MLRLSICNNVNIVDWKDDVLSQNVEAMEEWHEQVDGIVEGWYHE